MRETILKFYCDFCKCEMKQYQYLDITVPGQYTIRTASGALPSGEFCSWEHYILYIAKCANVKVSIETESK